jgi:hypothetical protein
MAYSFPLVVVGKHSHRRMLYRDYMNFASVSESFVVIFYHSPSYAELHRPKLFPFKLPSAQICCGQWASELDSKILHIPNSSLFINMGMHSNIVFATNGTDGKVVWVTLKPEYHASVNSLVSLGSLIKFVCSLLYLSLGVSFIFLV